MTDEEKAGAKKGESASEIWSDKPEKARRKDMDARWVVKSVKMGKIDRDGKSGERGGGLLCEMKRGYENHVSIDRKWRFVRRWSATSAARHDGHELGNLLDMDNGRETVWADSAQLSARNEAMPKGKGSGRGSTARNPGASRCPGARAART